MICYGRKFRKWRPTWRLSKKLNELNRARAVLLAIYLAAFLTGCDEPILHDLTEQDANRVLSRLSSGNLPAKKVIQSDGRWSISVSKELVVPSLNFLDSTRALSARQTAAGAGNKSGFVPSREEQRFRYERAVALSIEESLAAMRGVLEARVHLNLPENDPLFGTRKDNVGSGSVLLVTDSSISAKDDEISALVSGAAGIPAGKVSVLRSQAAGSSAETVLGQPLIVAQPSMNSAAVSVPLTSIDTTLGRYTTEIAALGGLVVCVFSFWMLRSRHKRVVFSLPAGMVSED